MSNLCDDDEESGETVWMLYRSALYADTIRPQIGAHIQCKCFLCKPLQVSLQSLSDASAPVDLCKFITSNFNVCHNVFNSIII